MSFTLLTGLANVVNLHMEDTGLRTMEVGTLSDMQNLTRLSLVGNQVQTIPSQLFRGLDKLEWVRFCNINEHIK